MTKWRIAKAIQRTLFRTQNDVVLPTARMVYVLLASISLIVLVIAIFVVVLAQITKFKRPPIPQNFAISSGIADVLDISASSVKNHLQPPKNIKFHVTVKSVNDIKPNSILGYFSAESTNNIPQRTTSFKIIGGDDANAFRIRSFSKKIHGAALVANYDSEIWYNFANHPGALATFSLRIIAIDEYGLVSLPETVEINFPEAVKRNKAAESTDSLNIASRKLSPLEFLAKEIAQHVVPAKTPLYFTVYKTALALPKKCNGSAFDVNNSRFVKFYRSAFAAAKAEMKLKNLNAFWGATCLEWKKLVLSDKKKAEQAANALRRINDSIRMQNNAALNRYQTQQQSAQMAKLISGIVAGGALAFFLTISLLLGFLALVENSRAMREAILVLSSRFPTDKHLDNSEEG